MNDSLHSLWYAFPGNKNAKLLIDISGSCKSALSLWHPYSFSGKVAKLLLALMPSTILRILLPKYTDQDKLLHHHNIARRILGMKNIQFHFSTGTPGPHRKTSAQAVNNGEIIAPHPRPDRPKAGRGRRFYTVRRPG